MSGDKRHLDLIENLVKEAVEEEHSRLAWAGATGKILCVMEELMAKLTAECLTRIVLYLVRARAPTKYVRQVVEKYPDLVVKGEWTSDILHPMHGVTEELLQRICHDQQLDDELVTLMATTLFRSLDLLQHAELEYVSIATLQVLLKESYIGPGRSVVASFIVSDHDTDFANRNSLYWQKHELLLTSIVENWGSRMFLHAVVERLKDECLQGNSVDGRAHHVLGLMKRYFPHQFQMKNQDGDLPIHIVSLGGSYRNGVDKIETDAALEFVCNECAESLSIPDKQGRLAIHLAAHHGRSSVDWIAEKAPKGLEITDPETGLFPAMLAAQAWDEAQYSDDKEKLFALGSIYTLLRKAPMVVASGTLVPDSIVDNAEFKKRCEVEMEIASLKRKHKRALDAFLKLQKLELEPKYAEHKRLTTSLEAQE